MSARAVLFDLDGVLIDSREAWFRVIEHAGEVFRGRKVTRDEFEPTFGQGTDADARAFDLGCSPAELDAFYAEHFPRFMHQALWVNPEAKGVLEELRARELKLALVTNCTTKVATDVLATAHLEGLLDVLSCADPPLRPKPEPDLLVHACRRLEVDAAHAVMVGDTRFDRAAALGAGCHFVGLRTEGDVRIERLGELTVIPAFGPRSAAGGR